MITQADVNEFLNEFGINNNLMEKLIKESVAIELKENIKLKQALQEIKEIAKKNKYYTYVLPSYSVAGDTIKFKFEFAEMLIKKINEVLDDTSN